MHQLSIKKLSKSFGTLNVIDGFDFDLPKGEFLALLGPSGCGKSTLLRIIAGLETNDTGSVEIAGREVSNLPPEKRNVALMFQSYALMPHMSVLENVRFPVRMQGILPIAEQRAKALQSLELVQLHDFKDRFPHQLSGGQQQRVALARAIVGEPDLLLLDEPLSNLDARLRDDMQVQLKRLHDQLGLTTVFVTHDQEEALALASHVILLSGGKIERQGKPIEVYTDPRTRFAAEFIGSANILELTVEKQGNAHVGTFAGISGIQLSDHERLQTGDQDFMLRKEAIEITPDQDAAILNGAVVTSNYLGSRVRTVVSVNGQHLEVISDPTMFYKRDDKVGLIWRADALIPLEKN